MDQKEMGGWMQSLQVHLKAPLGSSMYIRIKKTLVHNTNWEICRIKNGTALLIQQNVTYIVKYFIWERGK
jgi:hypothetical protein